MMFIRYAIFRFITMLLTLWVASILIFIIINLPPGDYLSNQIAELRATGQAEGVAKAEFLRTEYALDRPIWQQYLIWVGFAPGPQGWYGLIQGNFGWSFEFDRPVSEIVGDALWLTVLVNLAAVLCLYIVALPLGVIRGGNSDILGPDTLAEMKRRHPDLLAADVPDRGHVPFLDEPEALDVIHAILERAA